MTRLVVDGDCDADVGGVDAEPEVAAFESLDVAVHPVASIAVATTATTTRAIVMSTPRGVSVSPRLLVAAPMVTSSAVWPTESARTP